MKTFLQLALLPLLPTVTSSCSVPFPEARLTNDSAQAAELRRRFPATPQGTRMTLRAILTIRGMELPLTLHVWREQPDKYRAIFTDDLGGTPLHVVQRGDRVIFIARAGMLGERLARDGLCRDLAAWLFLRGSERDQPAVLADETMALLRTADTRRSLRWATSPSGPIDRIALGTNERLDSTIEVAWTGTRPASVRIRDHRFGFELAGEIREWQPATLTAKTFRTER